MYKNIKKFSKLLPVNLVRESGFGGKLSAGLHNSDLSDDNFFVLVHNVAEKSAAKRFSSVKYQTFLHKYNVRFLRSPLVSPRSHHNLDCGPAAFLLPMGNRLGCSKRFKMLSNMFSIASASICIGSYQCRNSLKNWTGLTLRDVGLTRGGGQVQVIVVLPPVALWSQETKCSLQSGRCSGRSEAACLTAENKRLTQ